ncbi:hypothetical protein SAMN04488128_103210 [Chitinophaga eiseniae]|uniref:Uncharacterized protein n=1 Tax=Chitinophaga eiseniae TaxID=634771 RepID=A0A1T4SPF0_9BACT|nr:hypothetical protein [Chitinophaga eiseniae]SKA30043.1 hypothetical protein SAMN04488128_103210 [Chitinophaga eiseniae]
MGKNQNEEKETSVALKPSGPLSLQVFDMSMANLPDLDKADVVPFDLMADYWEPENTGEAKNVYFDSIKPSIFPDFNDPSIQVEVDCAFFYEKSNGTLKPWRNASKRLVSLLEALNLAPGSVIRLEYLGKKKNKKNSFQSAQWSVKPLIIKQ